MEHQRRYSQDQESPNRGFGNPDNVALMASFTVTPVFAGVNLTDLCVDATSTISWQNNLPSFFFFCQLKTSEPFNKN